MNITDLDVTYTGKKDVVDVFVEAAAARGVACTKTRLSMERLPPGNTFRYNIVEHAGRLYSIVVLGNSIKAMAVPDNAILPETIRPARPWNQDHNAAFRAWLDEAARLGCKVRTVSPNKALLLNEIGCFTYKGRMYGVCVQRPLCIVPH